jgi:pimeloyl-ACP methyl ester carboxylesterase
MGEYSRMDSAAVDATPLHTVILSSNPEVVATCSERTPNTPTIVFLHGWRKNLQDLRPLGELLAVSNQRVVLVDLPGFGSSPLPSAATNDGGGWSTSDYAERVKERLEAIGVSEAVFVGHSFGGRISVRLASKYPQFVSALVLIGSHGIPRDRTLSDTVRIKGIQILTKTAKWIDGAFETTLFKDHLAPRFGSVDYKAAGDLRKTLVKTVNENLTVEASSIAQPTLLLWGEDDRETPVNIAQKFHRLIRGSELTIFPNKGHEPYLDVGAHLIATYVQKFLTTRVYCAR